MARPKKIKIPFSLEVWLRIALREKRKEDRWKIFKEWRRWYLINRFQREPTENELESELNDWQKIKFFHSNHELEWMNNLRLDFLPLYEKENRIARAKAMAAGRWSKKG